MEMCLIFRNTSNWMRFRTMICLVFINIKLYGRAGCWWLMLVSLLLSKLQRQQHHLSHCVFILIILVITWTVVIINKTASMTDCGQLHSILHPVEESPPASLSSCTNNMTSITELQIFKCSHNHTDWASIRKTCSWTATSSPPAASS